MLNRLESISNSTSLSLFELFGAFGNSGKHVAFLARLGLVVSFVTRLLHFICGRGRRVSQNETCLGAKFGESGSACQLDDGRGDGLRE